MAYTQPDDPTDTPRRTQILGDMGRLSIDDYLTLSDLVFRAEREARKNGDYERAADLDNLGEQIRCTYEHNVSVVRQHTLIETSAETKHGGSIDVWECLECDTVHADESAFHDEPCE